MASGEVLLTAVEKAALLARLNSIELQGGKFSTPNQKSTEIANVLDSLISAVEVT